MKIFQRIEQGFNGSPRLKPLCKLNSCEICLFKVTHDCVLLYNLCIHCIHFGSQVHNFNILNEYSNVTVKWNSKSISYFIPAIYIYICLFQK